MIKTFLKLSLLALMVLFFFSCVFDGEEVSSSSDSSSSSDAAEKTIEGTWVVPSNYTDSRIIIPASELFPLDDPIFITNPALSNAIRDNATIFAVTTVERGEIKITSNTITTTLFNVNRSLVSTNGDNETITLLNGSFPISSITGGLIFTDTQITHSYNSSNTESSIFAFQVLVNNALPEDTTDHEPDAEDTTDYEFSEEDATDDEFSEEDTIDDESNPEDAIISLINQYELSDDGNTLTFIYFSGLPEETRIDFTRK